MNPPSESSRRNSLHAGASMLPNPQSSRSEAASSRIIIPPRQSIGAMLWEIVSPLLWKLTVFYTKVFLFIASIGGFILTTILLYSLVYYLAVPKRLHTYPVFFDYIGADQACANVTLSSRQWEGLARPIRQWDRPTPHYDFDVSLTVEFPNTEYNIAQKPVMFETSALLRDHTKVATTRRGFLVPQMSTLARLFRDFVTMAVAGLYLYQDKQTMDIPLIESFPVMETEALSFIRLCMSPTIHIYSGALNFTSRLSGFRYLIAHHPIFVGIVVVGSVVSMAILGVILAYIVRYIKRGSAREDIEDRAPVEPLSPISPREEMFATHEEAEHIVGIRRRRD